MKIMLFSMMVVFSTQACPYETRTHSQLSLVSIQESILVKDKEIFNDIGLDITEETETLPGIVPVDLNGEDPDSIVLISKGSVNRILSGGAVLEDASTRSIHHFFDPQNGGVGGSAGLPSPAWILELLDTEGGLQTDDFGLLNQFFSYSDALDYFYLGLTLPDEQSRRLNLGLMFRSLGHVIHHLQDMAQPQHVRSDQHCNAFTDFPGFAFFCFITGNHNPSYYEKYTDSRINAGSNILATAITSVPRFATARQFWENPSKTGIAEYTSRNFVSDGTNYQGNEAGKLSSHPSFPGPEPLGNTVTVSLQELLAGDTQMPDRQKQLLLQRLNCINNQCLLDFIPNEVADAPHGTTINPRSSTLSVFDAEIRSRNLQITNTFLSTYVTKRVTSLNRFNFESAYPLLIPHAISYSAGLIDHFFRGRLEVETVEWSSRQEMLVTVLNVSEDPGVFADGRFEIYLDSDNGVRKPVSDVTVSNGTLPLYPGEYITLKTGVPQDLDSIGDNTMTIVYNGTNGVVGAEPGLATNRFRVPPAGRVTGVQGFDSCPQRSIGVTITFQQQPDNNGQVFLVGRESGWVYDFTGVNQGGIISNDNILGSHGRRGDVYQYNLVFDPEQLHELLDGDSIDCRLFYAGLWIAGEEVVPLPSAPQAPEVPGTPGGPAPPPPPGGSTGL